MNKARALFVCLGGRRGRRPAFARGARLSIHFMDNVGKNWSLTMEILLVILGLITAIFDLSTGEFLDALFFIFEFF